MKKVDNIIEQQIIIEYNIGDYLYEKRTWQSD